MTIVYVLHKKDLGYLAAQDHPNAWSDKVAHARIFPELDKAKEYADRMECTIRQLELILWPELSPIK